MTTDDQRADGLMVEPECNGGSALENLLLDGRLIGWLQVMGIEPGDSRMFVHQGAGGGGKAA